jgi:hypothetical protein
MKWLASLIATTDAEQQNTQKIPTPHNVTVY